MVLDRVPLSPTHNVGRHAQTNSLRSVKVKQTSLQIGTNNGSDDTLDLTGFIQVILIIFPSRFQNKSKLRKTIVKNYRTIVGYCNVSFKPFFNHL